MPNRREQEPPEDTLATTFKVGSALGPYLLLEKIGSGRLGLVFKGRHQTLQNDVAIKIHQYFPEDDFIGLAFKQSASFVAQMSHPNIVRLIDYGFQCGHAYMVMEYVRGTTLTDLIPDTFHDNWSARAEQWTHRAIEYATQLLAAVRYAHNCVCRDFNGNTVVGIMHGDIKPANVLVSRDSGKLKLTDFMIPDVQAFLGNPMKVEVRHLCPGPSNTLAPAELAILSERLTEPITARLGTPEYMAPEQWKGRVTMQTDIFSLGATFYQMFTGLSPAFRFMFGGGGLETLKERAYLPSIFAADYLGNLGPKSGGPQKINPFVPSWLDEAILKATDPEPERRYLSVADIETVFRRYAPRTEITYNIRELNMGDKYTAGQIVGAGPKRSRT